MACKTHVEWFLWVDGDVVSHNNIQWLSWCAHPRPMGAGTGAHLKKANLWLLNLEFARTSDGEANNS